MIVVDSQVHVWAPETPERPWFSAKAHLPRPFGYEDLCREMKAAGVDRAILVPPGWEGDRVDFALEGAAKYPDQFAVMGRIPIEKPESLAQLSHWKNQPGMLGIRVSFQKQHNRSWLTDGTSDWFWPAAEKAGIPVMVFAPARHAEIRDVAINHPRLRIIIDHMGLLREQDAAAAEAIERIIPLAECPNVYVKVTSIPLYSSEPFPYRNLHAPLQRLIGAFGSRRSFWGTDITRIWSLCTYRECVTLFTQELRFLSADDLEWIMGRGIAQCLEWALPA